MKYFLCLAVLLLTYGTNIYAQDVDADYALMAKDNRVELVNKDNLLVLKPTQSCLLVKFWIPNCPTAEKQFKEFIEFEKTAPFPVLFVGITNIPQKITDIANKLHYQGTLYMLDTTISSDIYKRFDLFRADISKMYHQKSTAYFMLMFDRHKKLSFVSDATGLPQSLKTKCK